MIAVIRWAVTTRAKGAVIISAVKAVSQTEADAHTAVNPMNVTHVLPTNTPKTKSSTPIAESAAATHINTAAAANAMTGELITAVTTLYYTITSYARKASNAVMEIAATRRIAKHAMVWAIAEVIAIRIYVRNAMAMGTAHLVEFLGKSVVTAGARNPVGLQPIVQVVLKVKKRIMHVRAVWFFLSVVRVLVGTHIENIPEL
jgi:hypothetical protein